MITQKALCVKLARKYPGRHCAVEKRCFWLAGAAEFREEWCVYVAENYCFQELSYEEAVAKVNKITK